MAAMMKSRKGKAATLVPLAMLSAAWTLSLVGVNSADAARTDGEQTVTLSLPPGVVLKGGSYGVQLRIDGKTVPAKVNVAGAAST